MRRGYLETKYYTAELREGVLHTQYKPLVHLNLHDAKAIVAGRLDFFQDLQAPILIKSAKVKRIDKEARDYLFSDGLININAMAFIEGKNMNRMVTTFMFRANSPTVPCQTFDDEQEALVWLQQYV